VEQIELGDSTAPTLVTRSHFDTGAQHESMKGKLLEIELEEIEGEQYWEEITDWALPPTVLMRGVDGQDVSFAHPTGRRRFIRELGSAPVRMVESEVTYDSYGNVTRNADYGVVENGDRSALDDERVTVTEFAYNAESWIVRHPFRSEIQDEHGTVLSRVENFYDDETFSGNNPGQVLRGNLTLKRDWIDPAQPPMEIRRSSWTPSGRRTIPRQVIRGSLSLIRFSTPTRYSSESTSA
jgi:hypothetical protein